MEFIGFNRRGDGFSDVRTTPLQADGENRESFALLWGDGQWENPGAAWLRNMLLRFGSGKASTKGYVKFLSYDVLKVSVKTH